MGRYKSSFNGEFDLEAEGNAVHVIQQQKLLLRAEINGHVAHLSSVNCPDEQLLAACDIFFCHAELIRIERPSIGGSTGLWQKAADNQLSLHAGDLAQYAPLWLQPGLPTWYPQRQVLDAQGRYHPQRPAQPKGELYRRFDQGIDAWVSLQALDIHQHAQLFSDWQNSPRVAAFWEQTGTLEEHILYLQELQKDPKVLPLIACINDEPFAYFEAYWAKEDRIAPYYDVQDFDRGIHMLVGNEQHRGPHKVRAWLTSLCHFLFLQDPRTSRIVSEPRADNERMIGYMQRHRFARLKEFNFPHKRAAMMLLTRDAFFEQTELYSAGG